ncbi:cell elongation-specific peptidoglycan biosynthesis regulator RodA [Oceanithermus profundus DSM 14977]|uniref:Peptidoglycan glycosyltransferase RodA n=1 Tax=Oceanithermus profundus (strain DSM 14977 / NBRC 100410 / VKM B-2274 / 506) TaxID=670487 RepID=E4U7I9_OCEP5|nr:rod shape-determining protein RodA [Oceanithermus profundus]ADR36438.1 cell elongation-specific peptidoglycan biosynthesis regulator RodA [Oceanithermus profundus DSM 14977]
MIRRLDLTLYDWPLALLTLGLNVAGLFVLASAAPNPRLWKLQLLFTGVAFVAAALLQLFRKATVYRWAYVAYGLSLLLLVAVLFFGREVNGARSWFVLGPFRLQPSELAKLALILALARFLHGRGLERWRDYLLPLALALPPVALTLVEPDLGGALVLSAIVFGIFFVRGLPWRHLAVAVLLAAVLVPTVVWPNLKPHQQERILVLLNPSSDPLGAGFQVIQSMIAIGSGGVAGKGYGQGTQAQLGFVPERHTDFIFSVLAEEMGLVGALAVLLGYAALLYRLGVMAVEVLHDGDRLVLAGVMSLLAFQLLVNVGVTLGVAPVTGITLPLMSYGGTSLLTTYLALGLAQLVYRDRYEPA